MNAYGKQLRTLLSRRERGCFARLDSPGKIQDFLDTLRINFEEGGRTVLSPRRVLRERRAHCLEASLFAAACLAYHDRPALLVDLQTVHTDYDHVIAVFKQDRLWGAISKTNRAMLRWRDPVYRTIRELAMSYFHEYYQPNGKKSLRVVSKPFDLRRYQPARWVTAEEDLEWIADDLDDSPHFSVVPRKAIAKLRDAGRIELRAMKLVEWRKK